MKYLLALCMVSMALQPLALQACPMAADQDSTHHAEMQDTTAHDCCESDDDEPASSCEEVMQCGSCALGLSLIMADAGRVVPDAASRFLSLEHHLQPTPPGGPPLRPPIS